MENDDSMSRFFDTLTDAELIQVRNNALALGDPDCLLAELRKRLKRKDTTIAGEQLFTLAPVAAQG